MQTAATKIVSYGTVRCSRQLSRNGSVMVFPGQVTDPTMQIAWRKTWKKHFSVNLREALDLAPGARLQDYLLINEGDFVSVNENIAQRSDRRHRTLAAHKSGRFLGISSGNLIFETDDDFLEVVEAGFPGTVTDIVPNRGAYLETEGSYVQGIWGNGKSGQGIILTLEDIAKDGILGAKNLSMAMSGSIVFANTCIDSEVLQMTARLSPGGLIFGALPSVLLPIAAELPFPVIVTDTIGAGRISDTVYQVLGDNIIRCAYLYSAAPRGNMPAAAEIIIPQEEYPVRNASSLAEAQVGCHVRILEGFYSGEIGYVSELLPKGMKSDGNTELIDDCVRVCIDGATEVVLPVNNIEVIETK